MKRLIVEFSRRVFGVQLTGRLADKEPETFRVALPFGCVDVTRAVDREDPDYWVHVRVNRPDDGDGDVDRAFGKVVDARGDIHGKHASEVPSPAWVGDPGLYHVAVRVGRDTRIHELDRKIDAAVEDREVQDLRAFRRYVEGNLERIERGGWTPLCFEEFLGSEERQTYGEEA